MDNCQYKGLPLRPQPVLRIRSALPRQKANVYLIFCRPDLWLQPRCSLHCMQLQTGGMLYGVVDSVVQRALTLLFLQSPILC